MGSQADVTRNGALSLSSAQIARRKVPAWQMEQMEMRLCGWVYDKKVISHAALVCGLRSQKS